MPARWDWREFISMYSGGVTDDRRTAKGSLSRPLVSQAGFLKNVAPRRALYAQTGNPRNIHGDTQASKPLALRLRRCDRLDQP